ncbi:CRTAC1 family protein [Halovulum sp. GXIMD14794]
MRRGVSLLAMICAAGSSAAQPVFEDLSGVLPPHVYSGGWEHFVGGGVAVMDCDADGWPDLFAAGGEAPALLLRNVTGEAGASLAFEPVEGETLTGVTGAYPLDMDADGVLDLFVLRAGPNVALRGLGGCRFEDATGAWGIDPGNGWSTAFSATWEPGAERPTLAVGNYVDRENPNGPFRACDTHQLLRPGPEGYRAEDIAPGYCTLSMLFTDWSGDGRADLWVSNDRHYYVRGGQEQLFRITPELSEYGPEDGWQPYMLWGMGIASRDLTGDARPEVAVTSMADQKLFELNGGAGPAYEPVAYDRGTTAHRPYLGDEGRPSTGWHVQFGDVDNDGLDDLFIAKGNVDQMPDAAMKDPDNLLMQGADGRFVEAGGTSGIGSPERSRGAALVDLNRDGLLDLVVVRRRAEMGLYRNVTEGAGNWLAVALAQPGGNAFAVGARIELEAGGKTRWREVQVGGGHAGGQAGPEHFGLGDAKAVRLRVRWPDGGLSDWAEMPANGHVLVRRGDGASIGTEALPAQ